MKMTTKKEMLNEQVSRRDFLKLGGALAAGMIAIPIMGMIKPVTNLIGGGQQQKKTGAAATNYETIIQEWWKWYYVGRMQTKPIFGMQFLAGTSKGYAERAIVVQAGNTVFFSPLNYLGKKEDNDIVPGLYDVKTNMPITDLGRIISPKPFSIGDKDETGELMNDVISDGYWIISGPLQAGNYNLEMWGVSANGQFKNSAKYELIVA